MRAKYDVKIDARGARDCSVFLFGKSTPRAHSLERSLSLSLCFVLSSRERERARALFEEENQKIRFWTKILSVPAAQNAPHKKSKVKTRDDDTHGSDDDDDKSNASSRFFFFFFFIQKRRFCDP